VRSAAEHREKNWHNEEVTWVRNNGVNYLELPIEKTNYLPDKQTQDQFLDIMADKANLPVLLHDSNGRKRVSILAAVWAVKAQGYSVADAIEMVRSIKEQPVTEAERNFIASLAQ
jgi:protein tyrosine/serine phosphatase